MKNGNKPASEKRKKRENTKEVLKNARPLQQNKVGLKKKLGVQTSTKKKGAAQNQPDNSALNDRHQQRLNRLQEKDKEDYFSKERDEEYKILYQDSEDETLDSRVTAVKKRQAQLRLEKRDEDESSNTGEPNTNKYSSEDDTDVNRVADGKNKTSVQRDRKNTLAKRRSREKGGSRRRGDDSDGDLTTDTDESRESETSVDGRRSEDEDSEGRADAEGMTLNVPTRYAKATTYIEINDEDSWFWDWKRKGRKMGKHGNRLTDKTMLGVRATRKGTQMSVHDELKYRIDSDQLKEYKKNYYERFRHYSESSDSSSRDSVISSSSSSDESQSSKTREECFQIEERARRKAGAYRFLDDSSDDAESKSQKRDSSRKKNKHRTKDNPKAISYSSEPKHHWDVSDDTQESSMSSESTSSSSDTERSGHGKQISRA